MSGEWEVDRLDLPAYLRRIGHDGPVDATPATLAALHRAHLAAIPFENLDIPLGRGISVELDAVQAKLVERRRGGYCYEHGLLFAAALERVGFTLQRLLVRVVGDGERARARTHMALRVFADREPWLADVGFGSGLLEPLRMDVRGPQAQGGWTFDLRRTGPDSWRLWERRGDDWRPRYDLDLQRQLFADVVVANHFTSTWPRSPFVTRVVAVRKDDDVLHELVDGRLTVTRPDGSAEARDLDDDAYAAALRGTFRLDVLTDEELERLIAARRSRAAPAPPPGPGARAAPA